MNDRRKEPKSQIAWGYYNYGTLVGIARTRSAAITRVEEVSGEPWKRAKHYMEVHKVRVERDAP